MNICRYCKQELTVSLIEGGFEQSHCANPECPKVRYETYAHQGGCGIRCFRHFTDSSGQNKATEVPPDFEPPNDWDGTPPDGFTPPLSFEAWKAAGEPEKWAGS